MSTFILTASGIEIETGAGPGPVTSGGVPLVCTHCGKLLGVVLWADWKPATDRIGVLAHSAVLSCRSLGKAGCPEGLYTALRKV